jgi:hypothetical protein
LKKWSGNTRPNGKIDWSKRDDVIAAATAAVNRAMDDGTEHGYTNEWTEQSTHEHLMHAARHLADAVRGDASEEAHLEHAVCRVAMAIIKRGEG